MNIVDETKINGLYCERLSPEGLRRCSLDSDDVGVGINRLSAGIEAFEDMEKIAHINYRFQT